jgi:iron complex transport system permease protein
MKERNQIRPLLALGLACIVLTVISLLAGRIWIDPQQAIRVISGTVFLEFHHTLYSDLILNIRLPRTILVLLVGATLSASGVALQSMYRNPLVSPYILGISSGAALGASAAILITGDLYITSICAFLGGLLVSSLTWGIDRFTTILAGMALGTMCGSLTALIKWISDPFTVMPFITFWLLGSFSRVSGFEVLLALPVLVGGLSLLYLLRWQFNVLSSGEETAVMLGMNTKLIRGVIIAGTTLVISISVSLCGVIGWVGLVIPHACRHVVGNDHIILLPVSLLSGAAYLLAVDLVIRTVIPGEMPIGIITGIVGAPLFIFLVWKVRTM